MLQQIIGLERRAVVSCGGRILGRRRQHAGHAGYQLAGLPIDAYGERDEKQILDRGRDHCAESVVTASVRTNSQSSRALPSSSSSRDSALLAGVASLAVQPCTRRSRTHNMMATAAGGCHTDTENEPMSSRG
jgi:hypothetical protein